MTIRIEIVYALPDRQDVIDLGVPAGTTVQEALDASGWAHLHPEFALDTAPIGIWGKHVGRDTILRDRDRVEIYRPLIADPKKVRRDRALRQRADTGRIKPEK